MWSPLRWPASTVQAGRDRVDPWVHRHGERRPAGWRARGDDHRDWRHAAGRHAERAAAGGARRLLEALPTGVKHLNPRRSLPGMAGRPTSAAPRRSLPVVQRSQRDTYHGKRGMNSPTTACGSTIWTEPRQYRLPLIFGDRAGAAIETAAGCAESDAAGVRLNVVPKEGGNTHPSARRCTLGTAPAKRQSERRTAGTRPDQAEPRLAPPRRRRVPGRADQAGQVVYFAAGRYTDEQESARGHFLQQDAGDGVVYAGPEAPGLPGYFETTS